MIHVRRFALVLLLAVAASGCWWTEDNDDPECVTRADPTPCMTCPVTTFRTTCPD
jgi:hypothetical protein